MNGKIFGGFLLALVLFLGAVTIGAFAYQAWIAQGVMESGKLPAPAAGIAPYPYAFHPFWSFAFLACFAPFLFVCLVAMLVRAMFWHGPRWGMHRHWDKGAPPMLEEWHTRAHSAKPNVGGES